MCQNVCLYHPLLSTVGIEVSSSILLCRCRSRYAVETFPVFCCFLAQFVSSCLRLRSCLPYSTYQVCFYLQFRTVHIRFVLCGFPDIKTYQVPVIAERGPSPTFRYHQVQLDVGYCFQFLCRIRTRYVVASFVSSTSSVTFPGEYSVAFVSLFYSCLLYTSPSPRDS